MRNPELHSETNGFFQKDLEKEKLKPDEIMLVLKELARQQMNQDDEELGRDIAEDELNEALEELNSDLEPHTILFASEILAPDLADLDKEIPLPGHPSVYVLISKDGRMVGLKRKNIPVV